MLQVKKIYGPPGTGKTNRLLEIMLKELSNGVRPDRLAYLTFTVQARREALGRAKEQFKLSEADLPYFKTLHAIAYRELGLTGSALMKGAKDLADLGSRLGVRFTAARAEMNDVGLPSFGEKEEGDRLLAFDHFRRHNRLDVAGALRLWERGEFAPYVAERFCTAYAVYKEAEALYDFTDLLERVDVPLPVDVVIVDEAQDLSALQWHVLHRFARDAQRLYIAGDDDQAIFTWAGASPSAFIAERADAEEVLGQSWRVPRAVQDVARTIVERITARKHKVWAPRAAAGRVAMYRSHRHADYDQAGTYLILYRHHYQRQHFEEHFRLEGRPYAHHDKPAPGAEWASAIVSWERLRKGKVLSQREIMRVYEAIQTDLGVSRQGRKDLSRLPVDFSADVNTLRAQYGLQATVEEPWFAVLNRISAEERQYLRAVLRRGGNDALVKPPLVRLSTMHGAKGAEADHVVLLTSVSGKVHAQWRTSQDPERRVFYVGVTRAKESLTLIDEGEGVLW